MRTRDLRSSLIELPKDIGGFCFKAYVTRLPESFLNLCNEWSGGVVQFYKNILQS